MLKGSGRIWMIGLNKENIGFFFYRGYYSFFKNGFVSLIFTGHWVTFLLAGALIPLFKNILYSAVLNLFNFALCVALIKCQTEQCFH